MAKTARKTRPSALEVGARVRTNAAFLRLFGEKAVAWRGEVLGEVSTMPGTWRVRVDGVEKPQWIHGKFLEVES